MEVPDPRGLSADVAKRLANALSTHETRETWAVWSKNS